MIDRFILLGGEGDDLIWGGVVLFVNSRNFLDGEVGNDIFFG